MDTMKENMLMNMNYVALTVKDFVLHFPNAVEGIYYNLGKMHSYEEMYKELFKEDIPKTILKNMTHASMLFANWEKTRRC